jgi:hypothetical protein
MAASLAFKRLNRLHGLELYRYTYSLSSYFRGDESRAGEKAYAVVKIVGSTCLDEPVSACRAASISIDFQCTCKLIQSHARLPYMENSQMFGKIVLNP